MGAKTLHPNAENDQIHVPKDFSIASKNDMLVKGEQGSVVWESRYLLPPALNFVDGDVAPPTEVHGDIYVIMDSSAIDSGWDGATDNDWLRYDTSADTWFSITPVEGVRIYNKTSNSDWVFTNIASTLVWNEQRSVQEATKLIESRDVVTLNGSPIELVAAPGSGKAIEVISWTAQAVTTAGFTAYDTNITLVLITDTAASEQAQNKQVLISTVARISRGIVIETRGGTATTQLVDNKALTVSVNTGEALNGNFDLKIFITYRIITL